MQGREIVVTGGGGGLGEAVVRRLAREGARLVLPVRSEARAASTDEALGGLGRVLAGIDATDEKAVDSLFAEYGEERPLWASIHLVGGFRWAELGDAPASVFDAMFQVNARSCYLASRAAAAAMRRGGGGGRIVNVTARPGLRPSAGASMVAYTGAKAAVAAMTVAMSEELAADDIWVNAVAPSIMDTPRNRRDMPDADHDSWPKPEDVAETIAFLASPANRSTRGGLVPVYAKA
ncbi:MAG: SDR family oxidoreductase [Gemmatimonadetes bacterium]|nr:SDR family oxidoreductase [Gemmatimonadota bacterium]